MKYDYKVLIRRKRLITVIFIETIAICVVSLLFFRGQRSEYFGSTYDICFLINGKTMPLSFIVLLVVPILGSVPNADIDEAEGNNKYCVIVKKGVIKYYCSKHLVTFISGFINVLYCLEFLYFFEMIAVNTCGTVYTTDGSLLMDFLMPDLEKQYFNNLIIEHPIVFTQMAFVLIAVFGGLCGNLSYAINQNIKSPGITYLGSFLIAFSLSFFLQFASAIGDKIPYYNVFHLNLVYSRISVNDSFIFIIVFCWLFLILFLAVLLQLRAVLIDD